VHSGVHGNATPNQVAIAVFDGLISALHRSGNWFCLFWRAVTVLSLFPEELPSALGGHSLL
jgi:hypothetical protein